MLLSKINQQLCEQGLYIKSGEVNIVDAGVIEAKQSCPNTRKDGSSTQDGCAEAALWHSESPLSWSCL